MKPTLACSLSALLLSMTVSADTRVYATNGHGQAAIFSSDGHHARLDNPHQNKYALIDLDRQQYWLVNPTQREALSLDQSSADPAAQKLRPHIAITALGAGPNIAGFATRKFQLKADGKDCAIIFGSQKASELKGLGKLFDALGQLQQRISSMMGGLNPMMDACSRAKSQSIQTFKRTGAPMRIVDAKGNVQSEVVRVQSDAQTSAGFYNVPPGYKVTHMQEQMKQLQQQRQKAMQEIQKKMPDMRKMVEQLQQNGKMPDEAVEQLRRMKEILKQRMPQ